MHTMTTKLNSRNTIKNTAVTATLTLLMIQLVTACSSLSPRHEKITNVLEQQNALIGKIKEERSSEDITAKVANDPTLAPAEVRLTHALDELSESNQVVQKAVIPNREPRGGMHD